MPNMSLNEALAKGLQVTGIGLIIVFAVLIILMLVMMAMKGIFYKPDKSEKTEKPEVKAPEEKTVPVAVDNTADDGELIAVIAAAVAAAMDVPVSSVRIKSYKKSSLPVWKAAGVRDIIDSRF